MILFEDFDRFRTLFFFVQINAVVNVIEFELIY